jgi:hypothetical protein
VNPHAPGVPTPLIGLLAFGFLMMFSCGGCFYMLGRTPEAAHMPPLGRGLVEPHGPTCAEITAGGDLDADVHMASALESIANRPDLTAHEQMHLTDVTLGRISADVFRQGVLVRLARNPGLTREGRDYLFESLKTMSTDVYRREVMEALRAR